MYRNLNAVLLACATLCALFSTTVFCSSAKADVFLLANGGRVDGKLLNPEQSPRKVYLVQPDGGGQLTLVGSDVERVLVTSEVERKYQDILPTLPDSEAAHWDMAQKCEKAGLKEQRAFHLEQVVRHNHDHEAARYALGYSRVEGRWQRQEEFMAEQGFIRHRGGWVLPQELALKEREREHEVVVVEWRKKVKLWRTWVIKGRSKAAEGDRNLREIRDPRATEALAAVLKQDKEPRELKQRYIEVLGRFDDNRLAIDALVWAALNDVDSRIREKAVDELAEAGSNRAVQAFVKALEHNENKMVLRAAVALGLMQDRTTTLPLIEALFTEHKRVVGGGGIAPTFTKGPNGGGGGGLNVGGKPKVVKLKVKNEPVLRALTTMHTGVNYGFNQEAWRKWFVDQNTPRNVNLRRTE
jgi:hypothetical protein